MATTRTVFGWQNYTHTPTMSEREWRRSMLLRTAPVDLTMRCESTKYPNLRYQQLLGKHSNPFIHPKSITMTAINREVIHAVAGA